MEKNQKNKRNIILATVLIVFVFFILLFFHISDNSTNETDNINSINIAKSSNTDNFIEVGNTDNTNDNEESFEIENTAEEVEELAEDDEEIDEEDEEEQILCLDIRLSTYFLTKYCLNSYYNYSNLTSKISLLDNDVKYLSESIVLEWINKDYYETSFAIDEIYIQELSEDMNLVLVYYRYTTDNETYSQSAMAIRVDTKNYTYVMYPYEYLQANNYSSLKEYDHLPIENTSSIEKNDYNQYNMDEIETTGEACTQELLDKLRFDALVDVEHLYNMLDEEYRELRFPELQDLKEYIEENRETIMYDELTKYRVIKQTDKVQISGITSSNKYITFNLPESLMDYTVYLDNYTVVLVDIYEDSVENWKASYCLERIFSAINEHDYNFIYEHLNPIQKSGYYDSVEELEEDIKNAFFDSNSFTIDDEYIILSDESYQYTVYATNEEDTLQTRIFTMTITVKDDTDFVVKIGNN